jgi:hypothetical protein
LDSIIMESIPTSTDLRGLELKLTVAQQALADLADREQRLAAKLRTYQSVASELARLADPAPSREEDRGNPAKAAELEARHAELVRREAEIESREKETLAARAEAMAARESLARSQAELDAGLERLAAAADRLTRAQREHKLAAAELERRSADHMSRATGAKSSILFNHG